MKINVQPINLKLDEMGVALEYRSYLLTVAAARVASYRLKLPAEAVENPYLYFTTTHKAGVLEMVGQLNEAVVINFDECVDLVQRLWLFRYNLAHNPNNPAVRTFLDACLKVGGVNVPGRLSEFLIRPELCEAAEMVTAMLTPLVSTEG